MKLLVRLAALTTLLFGVWTHDWRTILAGTLVWLIWPLIHDDITRDERATLDQLWNDKK